MVSEDGGGVGQVATVTAVGEAVVRAEPDEAMVWITLTALRDPAAALADVTQRSESLVALLDEFGIPKADRVTTGVTVGEEFDYGPEGRRSVGHRASASMSVCMTEPVVISGLIARVADQLQAEVSGPRWQIAPNNPARLEVARQAASQAQLKAQAYAEGLGAGLGSLVRVSEASDEAYGGSVALPVHAVEQADVPIERGEHEVRCAVQVTFTVQQR